LRPAAASPRNAVTGKIGPGPQQVSCAARPGAALGHDFSHAGRHGVSLDSVLSRGPAISLIGVSESTGGPKRGLTRGRPNGEVGHPQQLRTQELIDLGKPWQNAVTERALTKHAAYSTTALLPGEDPAAFKKLHQGLIAELIPNGPLEEDIVGTIAQLVWRKQNVGTFRIAEQVKSRWYGIRSEKNLLAKSGMSV
jgi:hypothetical protein